MAAYAALVSLINNIEQIMKHPRRSTSLENKHIHPLLEKPVSCSISWRPIIMVEVAKKPKIWRGRSHLHEAHAAEDVIESHIVDQIHAGTETSLGCSLDLQQKTQDMDAVMKMADEFKGKHGLREEQPTHATPAVEIGETAMVGLDAELYQLLDELTGHQSCRHTVSIVGMGGTGTTTLAKNVYEHSLIKEYFHCRAWATISQQHNAQEILSQLLYGLGISSHGAVGDSGLELHQHLTGRRYLIILDDIWSVEAMNEVRRFFPDNKNGSRVVLTTRLSNSANNCGSSPLIVSFLDDDNSWKLFCEKAFKNEACPPELRAVGEEIVKLCKGLALSIVVMGGLLSKSPRTIEYWKGVVRDIKSNSDSKENEESLDVLSLSYTHSRPHLKPCFLYMGVFREDSEIRVSNVVQLWVAEGFIKPIGCRVLEEIAEGYLQNLIDRNLILVGRWRKNGKIKCCGIHDLLRDLCLQVSEQQHFFHGTYRSSEMRGPERRLACSYFERNEHGILHTRSIIAGNSHGKHVKYRLLRILDQKYCDSAAELYESVNLRYLAYIHPFHLPRIWELPISVSLIWNLQTLIIDDVRPFLVVVAPTEIWKMRQLRHVKCNKIYLPPRDGQEELFIMDNLQTLKTAVNLRLSEEVCEIIPNIKKLHLRYNRELHGYDECLIEHMCNLDRLHKLETLIIGNKKGLYGDTDQLNMHGKIRRFPSSLKKLSLSYCGLKWEDLTLIGSLPQLEVLILGYNSVHGPEWSPINGEFRHLKYLRIECWDLEYWNADSSHFPVLEKLVLVDCCLLNEIPSDIGEIPTLLLICVDNCSVEAAVSAVKIKEDQLENENDDLQVEVTISDTKVASFKEMVSSIIFN